MEKITSKDNKKIKYLSSLKKSSKRLKEGKILIEGKKEIEMAIAAGVLIEELFFCDDFGGANSMGLNTTELTKAIFQSLAYRENPDGFLALAKRPVTNLENITLSDNPFLLVLETVEKPGNIGAMLRTADAVGVDAVILCDPQTDFYNPNVVRASLGALFTVPVAIASNKETLEWLKNNNINVYSAYIDKTSKDFTEIDFKKPSAIVIGTEHDGLSDFWSNNSDQNIKIAMQGKIDSLNASVSAAVIMYEAYKQKMLFKSHKQI